jgi:CHAT domain-containing protein/Tfp pilus assembly protein PilF
MTVSETEEILMLPYRRSFACLCIGTVVAVPGALPIFAQDVLAPAQIGQSSVRANPPQGSQNASQPSWQELHNRIADLRQQGKYVQAIPLAQQAVDLAKSSLGVGAPEVATSLSDLATLYQALAIFKQAETLYLLAIALLEKSLGPNHPDVGSIRINLATLYQNESKYEEAERTYQQALPILQKKLGAEDPEMATIWNNLAELYREEGKLSEAEPLCQRALEIRLKMLDASDPVVATSLNNLAQLYREQGKYDDAEPLLRQALQIKLRTLDPKNPMLATSFNNLASFYQEQGNYDEAEAFYKQALTIRTSALGSDHPDVAGSMLNLAGLYFELGRFDDAKPLFQRSLAILETAYGPDHPAVASGLNGLAEVYQAQGKLADAEPLLKRALTIEEKTVGLNQSSVAMALMNLGRLYHAEGKLEAAEPLLKRALAIALLALDPDRREMKAFWENLATLYFDWNRPGLAEINFDAALDLLRITIEKQFRYMSEHERLEFGATVEGTFAAYASFVASYHVHDLSVVGKMYDLLLWRKGMVASSVQGLRAKISASGNSEALSLLDKIADARAEVARIAAAPPDQPELLEQARKRIVKIQLQENDLERELARRSPTFAQQSIQSSWKDVRAKLKSGEAAVEYLRYMSFNGKDWTGKSYYAALVITPDTPIAPTFVMLGDAAELECGPVNSYRYHLGMKPNCFPCSDSNHEPSSGAKEITTAPQNPTFYQAFWKPLEPALGNAKRIYLSTDGVLSQVSLAVLPDESGQLLIEKYDLRMVISTKDLLRQSSPAVRKTAVLIGDPNFTATIAERQAALAALPIAQSLKTPSNPRTVESTSRLLLQQTRGTRERSFDLEDLTWPELPATKIEVQQIRQMLVANSWHAEMYTESAALEEVMKRLHGPRLLHVATHGFLLEDGNEENTCHASSLKPVQRWPVMQNPMLRSGLVFSGANLIASANPSAEEMDDGILTAYEAMELDLEGTELVILSACDTGLGQTQAEEGVFGLRRAIQVAGAQSVMMAMWEVPDIETQKLMKLFYQKWLSGEEKHEALREAQIELRHQIQQDTGQDFPQLWGAFVLVGAPN